MAHNSGRTNRGIFRPFQQSKEQYTPENPPSSVVPASYGINTNLLSTFRFSPAQKPQTTDKDSLQVCGVSGTAESCKTAQLP